MTPFEYFQSLSIKVGTVIDVQEFPEALNPSYKLRVNFGSLGVKKTSAQITKNYKRSDLIGKQIVALVDIPPKQIGSFMSECLILGTSDSQGDIIILQPENSVPNGSKIH